mmetsp:Transcript_51704/g.83430  ORF Transcript_51704/g.83430 Transcript_51704/m.83430 type:complete len:200 (-) Transcript_51704:370-969(-)
MNLVPPTTSPWCRCKCRKCRERCPKCRERWRRACSEHQHHRRQRQVRPKCKLINSTSPHCSNRCTRSSMATCNSSRSNSSSRSNISSTARRCIATRPTSLPPRLCRHSEAHRGRPRTNTRSTHPSRTMPRREADGLNAMIPTRLKLVCAISSPTQSECWQVSRGCRHPMLQSPPRECLSEAVAFEIRQQEHGAVKLTKY